MKISQCVTNFFNYQKMNVKKKYVTELWIHPQQIPKPFRRHRAFVHHLRGYSGFHVQGVRWNQTEHKEITIHPPVRLFQFCKKFNWSWFSKSMWQSRPTKAIQGRKNYPVQNPGKGRRWWNHFQNTQSKKPAHVRTHGPWLNESRRGSETHTQGYQRPEGYHPGSQEWQWSGGCLPAPRIVVKKAVKLVGIHPWPRPVTPILGDIAIILR